MKLLKIANIGWGLVLIVLLTLSILFAYISTDAPYYLSIARDISRGNVPYKDIYSSYTPVMVYLNAIIYIFWKGAGYNVFLIFQYAVIFISAFILKNISRNSGVSKPDSWFIFLMFVLAVLSCDGIYINLEVYIALFVLIAFYSLERRNYFWCGVFLALSFFSKQYGILNFIPFFLLIFFQSGFRKKNVLYFIAGSLLPLIVFIIYFVDLEGVSIFTLLKQLTRNGLTTNMLDVENTWFSLLAGSKVFLLIVLPLFLLKIKPFKDKIDAILIVGILVNLIPLVIQNFAHYYILSFPYIFILIAKHLKNVENRTILLFNLAVLIISGLLFLRVVRYRNEYKDQLAIAEKYRTIYPVGSEVFLYKGYRFLYILNDYQNPVLEDIGYRYEFFPDKKFREKYNVIY